MSSVEVVPRPEQSAYEALVDGERAGLAVYRLDGERVVFLHTEVDEAHEGSGVGSALVRGALDDVRAAGRTVVPLCGFVRAWMDRHPDYADLRSG